MTDTTTEDVEQLAHLHDRKARKAFLALTDGVSDHAENATRADLSEARKTAATLRALAAERGALVGERDFWKQRALGQRSAVCACVFDENGDTLLRRCAAHGAIIDALAARVERLEGALRWYASNEAWTMQELEGPGGDYGKRARAALRETTDE